MRNDFSSPADFFSSPADYADYRRFLNVVKMEICGRKKKICGNLRNLREKKKSAVICEICGRKKKSAGEETTYLKNPIATPPSTFSALPVDLFSSPPTKANTAFATSSGKMISFSNVRLA